MRNRKKHKTMGDFSVSQLLDDFIKIDALDTSRHTKDVEDEEYIRMMLKKDVQRKLERTKRESRVSGQDDTRIAQSETIDDEIRQRFFPDVSQRLRKKTVEKEAPKEEHALLPENGIVEEILASIVVKDVSGLAARMKEAVDFVQDELGTSEAERRLIEALEECKKPTEPCKKKSETLTYNDNVLVLKRCQNCHFCAGEKNRSGSVWCLCTNSDRTTDVEIEDTWVKSKLNLPCWKAPQD